MKCCLLAVCLFALSVSTALAQQTPAASDDSAPKVNLNSIQQKLPSAAPAVYLASVREGVTTQDLTSSVIKEEIPVAANSTSVKSVPPTMMVRTTTLLELHAMRQNAVNLCIQLPSKYRTRLPQCAEIFKHEIRLETFARENH